MTNDTTPTGEYKFNVYREVGTPGVAGVEEAGNQRYIGRPYYYHGHFMPYNDIDTTINTTRIVDQWTNSLPVEDGRTYEDVYGIKGKPNFYHGMMMEAKFLMPEDGKSENGDDIIYRFTGDDDLWVYVDDVLVLDVGGIHEALTGTINFTTGKVTGPAGSSTQNTTLREIFQSVNC